MAKPKSKSYKYDGDGEVTISLAGDGLNTVTLAPGDTYETDDPAKQAALEANPDVEVKGKK